MTDVSLDDFEPYWAAKVAEGLDLDVDTLSAIYQSGDQYNTNSNTRAMWKYAMAKGVSGTPTAFVNGVKLDNMPFSVNEWLSVLNSVYKS
jgi:protein-disulfide isomerase